MQYQEYQRTGTKPEIVKATQFTDTKPETLKNIQVFAGDAGLYLDCKNADNPKLSFMRGGTILELGDYVVLNTGSEMLQGCEKEFFESHYKPVTEKPALQYARHLPKYDLAEFLRNLINEKLIYSFEISYLEDTLSMVNIPFRGEQYIGYGDYVFRIGNYVGVCNSKQFEQIKAFVGL